MKSPVVDVSQALQRTLDTLAADGRLGEVDDALVELAKGLAEALKLEPTNAALWREYRMAIESLMRVEGAGDDETQAFWLRVRTAVVDSSGAEPAKSRSGRGRDSHPAGSAVDAVAASRRGHRPRAAP